MTLEVQVTSSAAGGLKIIEHIPPVRPCRLEGRNGIGKSALVRLLVLVSGHQPYLGEPAPWRSLKQLVGKTSIYIEGLGGDISRIRVALTPELWPDDPVETVGDWLGTVEIDGSPASVPALQAVFDVVHLSGTERLVDTLKQQNGTIASSVKDVARRLDQLDDQRAEFGETAELLQFVSPSESNAERHRLDEAVLQKHELEQALEPLDERVMDLSKASALLALIETGDVAEHQQRLQELRAALERVRSRQAAAEKNHTAAVDALAAGTATQRDVAKREKRLGVIKRLTEHLLERQEELASRLDTIGLPADVEIPTPDQAAALDAEIELLNDRYAALERVAAKNRRSQAENVLVDNVRVVLDDAVSEGLSDTVLARVWNKDLTVKDLRTGLGLLSTVVPTDLGELAATAQELAETRELKTLFGQRSDLASEDDTLRKELQALEPDAVDQDELRRSAQEARHALDAASAEVHSTLVQIGAMSRSTLGGSNVADIEAVIAELLTKQDVEQGDLTAQLAESQSEILDLRTRQQALQAAVDELSASGTRRRIQREALRRAGHEDRKAWLAQLALGLFPDLDVSANGADWSDEVWQRLADLTASVRSSLSKLVSDVGALQAVADQGLPQSGRIGGAIRRIIEADALVELSVRPIADALFDGGVVDRVSLDDGSVTWTTAEGETRTRPMTAFSSGEQALGFLRARLQQIADTPSFNRLVFLDEFGAFISADRRRPLADLLTSQELLGLADQIVVILPLQADYQQELGQTTGALRALYEARAAEVAAHGYFAEEFTR